MKSHFDIPAFVKCPDDLDTDNTEYLTPAKVYETSESVIGSDLFWVQDDEGVSILCRLTECAHIGCLDWIPVGSAEG